jgi:hypothetical protein
MRRVAAADVEDVGKTAVFLFQCDGGITHHTFS